MQKLLQQVEKANLSNNEIQSIIDLLLHIDGSVGGEWVEKGKIDPTDQLRRKCEELEKTLSEQKDSNTTLSTKITELRSELNNERSRGQQARRQLETISATHQKQLDAATAAKNDQTKALDQLKGKLEQDFKVELLKQTQILTTETEQLTNQVQQLKASLSEAELRCSVARQEHEELTQRCQKYEQHITSIEEKHASQLATHLASNTQVSNEREQLTHQINTLTQDLSKQSLTLTQTQHSLQVG